MSRLFQVDLKAAQHVLRPEPSAGHGGYNHDGIRCQGTASSVAIMDYTDRTDSGEATEKVTTQSDCLSLLKRRNTSPFLSEPF